eukprot:CAMPEP_0170466912 /NCGR_PEP_ID=MMETSP0123-20130129/10692_1 /TAXON_ID=182087 /ORGANISM="Favella ehrenbergii, Strain Fehren 1" /LENGTH=234 /DNA_ID=CAMNT_0010733155 /DNA_START=161 /DNA_END=867 /DNA_ORIENTATION=-
MPKRRTLVLLPDEDALSPKHLNEEKDFQKAGLPGRAGRSEGARGDIPVPVEGIPERAKHFPEVSQAVLAAEDPGQAETPPGRHDRPAHGAVADVRRVLRVGEVGDGSRTLGSDDPETDEGLIEEDIDHYMSCFSVDLSGFDQLLIKEIKNRKADLESAQQEAETLQEKMQEVLVTNEQGLKNFLEESKFKVDLLAAAERERAAMAKQEFKDKLIDMHGMSLIETNLKMKKDAAA